MIQYPLNKQSSSYFVPSGVEKICFMAFESCKALESIVFSDSVKEIAPCAFSNCNNLASVEFGKNITCIGLSAFSYLAGSWYTNDNDTTLYAVWKNLRKTTSETTKY